MSIYVRILTPIDSKEKSNSIEVILTKREKLESLKVFYFLSGPLFLTDLRGPLNKQILLNV